MELNLNVAFDMDLDSLCETADALKDPAIILDDSLRVVFKNKMATHIFPNLRKGRQVGGLVVTEDKERLRSLSVRQTVLVKLLNGEIVYGATAVRFPQVILLVVRPLSAGLRERLEEVYTKASGYDINICSEQLHRDELFSFSLKNLCFPKETRFFNVAVVTEGVINQLRLKYPRVFERIDIKSSLKDKYTLGSEYDFSIILTYITSFCIQNTKGKIGIELLDKNGVLSVKISEIRSEDTEQSEELTPEFSKDNVGWQNLIKMLSDGNLWDFDIGCGYKSSVCFTLKMPAAEEKQPFVLSDSFKKTVAKILSAFFG